MKLIKQSFDSPTGVITEQIHEDENVYSHTQANPVHQQQKNDRKN